ncbi:hypothetical protein [Pedobacter sp.]|jgi:hypothetical protein|uniref:hypothetical protein n=1 Tax=Pedobacter sp. TaxID=1411316 RepID=UPI002C8301B4|nr:hypothetical protein [Pedobacter sp.]HWW38051.1 hypothetical protein [Pedobacter sp.]
MANWNKKGILISTIDQYIIDSVRTIRVNLDLSQKKLSSNLSHSQSTSLIGNVESIAISHKYTEPQLHELAHIFTEEAKRIKEKLNPDELPTDFQTEYTLYDFYPKESLPDVLVAKSRNIIINKIYPTGAIRSLMEDTEFLNIPRTTKEVTQEANRLFEKKWNTTDFNSPLDRAVTKGDLVKTEPPLQVTYQKSSAKNTLAKK